MARALSERAFYSRRLRKIGVKRKIAAVYIVFQRLTKQNVQFVFFKHGVHRPVASKIIGLIKCAVFAEFALVNSAALIAVRARQ